MVIPNTQRTATSAFNYADRFDENEWTRARKAVEFLDLDDHSTALFESYKSQFHSRDHACFQRPWITVFSREYNYHVDDWQVLFKGKGSCAETYSIFFNLSMKNRDPDWIGRNVFLEYITHKIGLTGTILDTWRLAVNRTVEQRKTETDLEKGESAVRFFDFAQRCGFSTRLDDFSDGWGETTIDGTPVCDLIFQSIYPSILRGLYQKREGHPLLAMKLLDMFCVTWEARRFLFYSIPDSQHLEFLLGIANRNRFDFWGSRDAEKTCMRYGEEGLRCLHIIGTLIRQSRFDLIMVLLRHGFTINDGPFHLNILIARYVLPMPRDGRSEEFKEMFRMLYVSLPAKFYRPVLVITLPRHVQMGLRVRSDSDAIWLEIEGMYNTCVSGIKDGNVYKLQHICRSVVRKRLRDNFQLPRGIYDLHIPNFFKEYLDLHF